MKRSLLFSLLLIIGFSGNAQELNLQVGKSLSKFKFKNSLGQELQNLRSTDNFFMTLEYRKSIFTERLFADLGLGYNRYGATGSDAAVDNYFAWDVTYLGMNLGLDYEFLRAGKFSFYLKGAVSPEFLIRGTQTLNNQTFNLVGEEDFDAPIYFFRAGLGAQFEVTNQTSFYIQYLGGKSYTFSSDPQELNMIAHSFGFGALINLSKGTIHSARSGPSGEQRIKQLEETVKDYSDKIEDLETGSQRVQELEDELAAKNRELRTLKNNISKALFEFDGQGLQVYQKQGKVYVTMDADMLFESGSWVVSEEGVKAVGALGRVLAEDPELAILIEGHTDNQPFRGDASGVVENNWDLSMKRATAIIEILKTNTNIDPKNLTAAGRGEHVPLESNETAEGRAKNRRIEVIMTPNLEEVSKLLKD